MWTEIYSFVIYLPIILQIGCIICVLGGIVYEVKTKAHWGYIFLTLAGWLAFLSEKIRG